MPYKDPEEAKQQRWDYYQHHQGEIRKLHKAWAGKNQEKCLEYGRKYRKAHQGEINERKRGRYKVNPSPYRKAADKYQAKLRLETLIAYAGNPPKCACCGERHIEFLGIDHIGGGGNEHKKQIGHGRGVLYSWLKRQGYPEGFRVLCHNCNLSLGFYGYCPHQVDRVM